MHKLPEDLDGIDYSCSNYEESSDFLSGNRNNPTCDTDSIVENRFTGQNNNEDVPTSLSLMTVGSALNTFLRWSPQPTPK